MDNKKFSFSRFRRAAQLDKAKLHLDCFVVLRRHGGRPLERLLAELVHQIDPKARADWSRSSSNISETDCVAAELNIAGRGMQMDRTCFGATPGAMFSRPAYVQKNLRKERHPWRRQVTEHVALLRAYDNRTDWNPIGWWAAEVTIESAYAVDAAYALVINELAIGFPDKTAYVLDWDALEKFRKWLRAFEFADELTPYTPAEKYIAQAGVRWLRLREDATEW